MKPAPILLLVCLMSMVAAHAQLGVTVKPPLPANWQDSFKGPHVGPVEEALVGIRITGTRPNGTPLTPRTGCGFVLRCDGFLVVPFDLFNISPESTPSAPERQTLHFTFHPGTEQSQIVSMSRRSRNFIDNMRRFGFTVFRVDAKIHLPALRTLLPDTLKAGDNVEVVWRDWNPSSGRYGELVRKSARLAAKPENVNWKGLADESFESPGRIMFSEPLVDVPAGAVVIGPEGLAVGMIPGSATAAPRAYFTSFAELSTITNCVGPVPSPDALFHSVHAEAAQARTDPDQGGDAAQAAGAAPAQRGMVKVPGGPLIVPSAMLTDQPDMEGQEVACMAAFEIDRLEVTNGEYLAFWNSLDEKQRNSASVRQLLFPLGWAPEGEPFPNEISSLPVLGVPIAGAKAYARTQGKRLPTPYEWAKAALGPNGETETPEWIKRYILDRQKAWIELCRAHAEYLRENPNLLEFARHPIDEKGKPQDRFDLMFYSLPWIFLPKGYGKEERFSYLATEPIMSALNDAWKAPGSVIAIGSRPYDVSPYGAMDMLLNAYELYLPNPGGPVFGNGRYMTIEWQTWHRDHVGWVPAPFAPWLNSIEFPWGFWFEYHWPWCDLRFSRLYKRTVQERDPPLLSVPVDRLSVPKKLQLPPRPLDLDYVVFMHNVNMMSWLTLPLKSWSLIVGGLYEVASVATSERIDFESVTVGRVMTRNGPKPEYGGGRIMQQKDGPWTGGALYNTRELGYPPATAGTILVPPQRRPADVRFLGPTAPPGSLYPLDLYYILPVGFRCAR